MAEQTVGNALEKFSLVGWPSDQAGIQRIVKPLEAVYGVAKITSERYPDWGPSKLIDGKVAQYNQQTGRFETNPELFIFTGMRWSLEFPNGQTISVVILNDRQRLIERTYTDRGDIPISKVYAFLKTWQSSFRQAQRGHRPSGRSQKTIDRYIGIATDWENWLKVHRNGEVEDFSRNHNLATTLVYRAIKQKQKIVSSNRL